MEKFKEKLIQEINTLKPELDNKSLENSILLISKEYLVNSNKIIKEVNKQNVFENCNLDFDINLVQSKTLPASNHLIGHIIVGGLRRPGIPPPQNKNLNDLWRCSIGVAIEKDINIVELLKYELEAHLNEDTFNEACKKAGVNIQRNDIENERILASAIFYHQGLKIIQNEFK